MEELPKPLSKQDKFLHNIADGTPDIDDIEAISRQDKYLKYIALNGGTSGGNASQEVGEWSPTLVNYTDSSHPNTVVDPTYSVVYSNAYYLKMGKLVHISFRVKVEITDIGTGFACVAGLPFNPDPNMLGQAFTIAENSAVTESEGVVYDGVVGQLYPDIYLETYNERHIPAISLRTDNGIQAKTFKVGTNWISYSGCYICDDPYVPPQESLVTIEHGGTGATTVSEARNNLGVYSKAETDSFLNSKANTADLSTVATSGSYIDLSNKPTIPTKTSDLENDSNYVSNNANNSTGTAIGVNSNAPYSGCTSYGYNANAQASGATAIGYNSITRNNGVAVGCGSTTDLYATAVGYNSKATGQYSLALGNDTEIDNLYYSYSVALGSKSKVETSGVVSVGDGSDNEYYGTRRIVNVSDPLNAQDVATKNYVDNHLAGLSIPSIPSSGIYTLQASDGVLNWVQSS